MDEMHDTENAPLIPAWLAGRPVQGNLVVPWIAARGRDGRYYFGVDDTGRRLEALTMGLCGVCGRPHEERVVFLMRISDLPRQRTTQPGLHPQCLAYTRQACPMIGGNMSSYRSTPRQLGPGLELDGGADERIGAVAEPWFAVWVASYEVVSDSETARLFASYSGITPLRVRPVSWWLHEASDNTPVDPGIH